MNKEESIEDMLSTLDIVKTRIETGEINNLLLICDGENGVTASYCGNSQTQTFIGILEIMKYGFIKEVNHKCSVQCDD